MIAFDVKKLEGELQELEAQMAAPGFWGDKERAKQIAQQSNQKKTLLRDYRELKGKLEELEVLCELAEAEGDESSLNEATREAKHLEKELISLELKAFMDGEYDKNDCYLSLNAGAGGTDAQDWTRMLLIMYSRWLDLRGFHWKMLEASPGEVAGLKSATLEVNGDYAYGYLKAEQGVHRLVRISPFDASHRRHTSFAAVTVVPKIEDPQIELKDEDLKIDTFRAGGAGGQYVNKTDSAVRITHLPTGIVVACQSERSQHQNKEIAIKILKARLYELKLREKERELKQIQGELRSIEWGSQIRSYVLQPYQLVKDHRTDIEVGNVEAVLDGELDVFIEGYLHQGHS